MQRESRIPRAGGRREDKENNARGNAGVRVGERTGSPAVGSPLKKSFSFVAVKSKDAQLTPQKKSQLAASSSVHLRTPSSVKKSTPSKAIRTPDRPNTPKQKMSTPRSGHYSNTAKLYSDVPSPVGQYIRGLSPTVVSPAAQRKRKETPQLRRAASSPAIKRMDVLLDSASSRISKVVTPQKRLAHLQAERDSDAESMGGSDVEAQLVDSPSLLDSATLRVVKDASKTKHRRSTSVRDIPNQPGAETIVEYLAKVRQAFKDDQKTYQEFVALMKEIKDPHRRVNADKLASQVREMFKGHQELILGFNVFLPPSYTVEVPAAKEVDVEKPRARPSLSLSEIFRVGNSEINGVGKRENAKEVQEGPPQDQVKPQPNDGATGASELTNEKATTSASSPKSGPEELDDWYAETFSNELSEVRKSEKRVKSMRKSIEGVAKALADEQALSDANEDKSMKTADVVGSDGGEEDEIAFESTAPSSGNKASPAQEQQEICPDALSVSSVSIDDRTSEVTVPCVQFAPSFSVPENKPPLCIAPTPAKPRFKTPGSLDSQASIIERNKQDKALSVHFAPSFAVPENKPPLCIAPTPAKPKFEASGSIDSELDGLVLEELPDSPPVPRQRRSEGPFLLEHVELKKPTTTNSPPPKSILLASSPPSTSSNEEDERMLPAQVRFMMSGGGQLDLCKRKALERKLTPAVLSRKKKFDAQYALTKHHPVVPCLELQVPAQFLSSSSVRARGWLSMCAAHDGEQVDHQWKRRWVVVYNNMLFAYASKKSSIPLYAVLLDQARTTQSFNAYFEVETRVGRIFNFKAQDSTSAEAWVQSISSSDFASLVRQAKTEERKKTKKRQKASLQNEEERCNVGCVVM